jgi:hypothetical protein
MSDLVTIPQAAAILKCDRSTVWRMVDAGKLKPAIVIDNPVRDRVLLYRRDVEARAGERQAS